MSNEITFDRLFGRTMVICSVCVVALAGLIAFAAVKQGQLRKYVLGENGRWGGLK